MERVIAKKSDYETIDMPEERDTFLLKRHFTKAEIENLRYGNIPKAMEDKWFWYFEDGKLFAHRSWTGFCIFIISFDFNSDKHLVTVNRNKNQYNSTIQEDKDALNHLLDWWVQPQYDYYNEWLDETFESIKKSKGISDLKTDIGIVDAIYFHKPEEPFGFLSNWYPSEFVLDGVKYTSVEQYIMARKCQILGDDNLASRIMATDDVAMQQSLARKTAKYSEVIWNGMRQVVAMRGLYAKFDQNADLRNKLLDTMDAYLVECAWKDKVWSCGKGLDSEDRKDMSKWDGKNILGFALMEVRNMLQAQQGINKPSSQITVLKGDITKLECDCIVNAANKSLLGGGGVDGAIHRAAGPRLLDECRKLHGCNTGEAKITSGYNLPANYVIHTVGPVYSGDPSDAVVLSDCYRNSLNLAKEKDIHSIAFPAISTGVYGYPLEEATEIAVSTVREWISINADYQINVIFCAFDESTEKAYNLCLS